MKILHTSDWHLGHTLYDFERSEEQKSFLDQLRLIVENEKPDAMVVSGDVFHTTTPSATAQRMYTDGIIKIHQACPSMSIIITAGNHDSSSKLEINSRLWDIINVKVIGTFEYVSQNFNFDKHIIEIKNPAGELQGFVVAIPHSYPNNFPILKSETPREKRQEYFFKQILEEVKLRNPNHLPVVLMAHLSATGCDITGHNETVGGIEYVDIQEFGNAFDYLALGHIHCPQTLKNSNGKARYCGSPLAVSFDENYPHSVTIVELNKNESPIFEYKYITNPKPLFTIPKEPALLEDALQQLDKNIGNDEKGYIRLNLLIDDYLPIDAKEKASEILRNKQAKLCTFKLNYAYKSIDEPQSNKLTLEQIQEISPIDIAQMFYEQKYGKELPEDHKRCLEMAINQVKEEGQE